MKLSFKLSGSYKCFLFFLPILYLVLVFHYNVRLFAVRMPAWLFLSITRKLNLMYIHAIFIYIS